MRGSSPDVIAVLEAQGAEIVEVAPAYDHADITGVAGSHVAYELVTLMADNAADGGPTSGNGYAAQALGRENRRPAGFAAPVQTPAASAEAAR